MTIKSTDFIAFLKYNATAIIATTVDFLILVFFTELLKFWYLLAGTLGAISGGITAFFLGRNWAFESKNGKILIQAIKYTIVWLFSIILNVSGLYIMVDIFNFQYLISKVFVAIIVGVAFNYFMQKHFVFK